MTITIMKDDIQNLLISVRELHGYIRKSVVSACEANDVSEQVGNLQAISDLTSVDREASEDTIYTIDCIGEQDIISGFADIAQRHGALTLVGEGMPRDGLTLPSGTSPSAARWRIIVDPIDGTRGLMYQKRSAWILTGVAPNLGPDTTLADLFLAVQTEIPLVKQHLCDTVWAIRGNGVNAVRYNRLTQIESALRLTPSSAISLRHGFATVARFFPGVRELLGALDDKLFEDALGSTRDGRAISFEDQYISSGGQLYELMAGHDRLVVDIRPLALQCLSPGRNIQSCAHPYDLCTEMIAREAGVVVCGVDGQPLRAPLDVTTPVGWVAYANQQLKEQIHPLLLKSLERCGLRINNV